MAVTYEYTKAIARINSTTSKVTQWEFEVTATDSVDSVTEVAQYTVLVASGSQKAYGSYTTGEIQTLADDAKTAGNWEAVAAARLVVKQDRISESVFDHTLLT